MGQNSMSLACWSVFFHPSAHSTLPDKNAEQGAKGNIFIQKYTFFILFLLFKLYYLTLRVSNSANVSTNQCGTVPTDMSSVDPDTYSRTVVSLSQRQTLVSEVSNAVALNFLDLYSFGLHRKEKKQPCSCAAHRADSVSADKPN